MKTKLIRLILAVFGLLALSSCGCPQEQPFIRTGVFGPGTGNHYLPCTGLPGQYNVAQGSLFFSRGCGGVPAGQFLGGGVRMNGFRPPVYIHQGFNPYGGCNPHPQCGPFMSPQANWNMRFPPPRPLNFGRGNCGVPFGWH